MTRWYDKNPDLAKLFSYIEKLSEDNKNLLAQDILQILINEFGLDLDNTLNMISKNYNYVCKRWYDKNIDLFTSFEIIKTFSAKAQTKIIERVLEEVINNYIVRIQK